MRLTTALKLVKDLGVHLQIEDVKCKSQFHPAFEQ